MTRISTLPIVIFLVICSPQPAVAQPACARPVGQFESIRNSVQLTRVATSASVPALRQGTVCVGDRVRVGDDSRAVILMVRTNTPFVIDQNSEFVVTEPTAGSGTIVDLLRGALLFITRVRQSLEVRTPFVSASVEGTEFLVRVDQDRTTVTVFEGTVLASNPNGKLSLSPGQQAVAIQGQAPQLVIPVRPRDAVQWALYYEPVLPPESPDQLAAIPEGARDAAFYLRRASAALGAGQIADAQADLDRAQQLTPASAEALALRAIIAIALNDKASALTNARQAVAQNPQSLPAAIALSYALQADFQLEEARDVLQRALALPSHASDGQAWARLAELQLALGNAGASSEAANRAVSLAPQSARAQSIVGFTHLTATRLSDAFAAFERAIELEPDSPTARLGLGLTKIRRGDLAEGRADLEIAVALNPDNSLLRSYLGKAYFEEKREPLPGQEFELAKTLDPLDPTPWFYDAIRLQTLNRPVEALQSFETAIRLNGNRAVYRSRFLLDQDLAARSASLGRLYRDLRFEQLAAVEGWKSLAADPTDYSGHRLLADTYSALPRHEVARVSELLQSQLLQPINILPVSPRLAETDLFIVEHAGPSEVGLNEFNSLLNRNRLALRFSGVAGNREVLGDEAMVSAVWNRLSFSVGQFHYETNGFRQNNQNNRDIGNAFFQAALTPTTSVQAEYRSHKTDAGDLTLLFDPENFSADQSIDEEAKVARVGIRHVFSPSSQVIASVFRGDRDTSLRTSASGFGITTRSTSLANATSWNTEVRHLWRTTRFSLTSGVGHFQSERQRTETTEFELPLPPFIDSFEEQFSDDPRQTNAYAYSVLSPRKDIAVTAGVSADFYESSLFSRNQFNPKVGVTWTPVPSTAVRVAAFRTLHRAVVASQTIEPTQVAGFNQFFADTEGEDAVRYGVALDQKIHRSVFGGVEYSWRDLSVPIEFAEESGSVVDRFDRKEWLARFYGYWTPVKSLSVNAEYIYERFDRTNGPGGEEGIVDLRTHRLPVGLRYFSSTGLIGTFQVTHLRQKGSFSDVRFAPTGDSHFWVVDFAVGYRLPKRYGIVSFEVKNLLDEKFKFQDSDPGNPVIKPRPLALVTFTVGM